MPENKPRNKDWGFRRKFGLTKLKMKTFCLGVWVNVSLRRFDLMFRNVVMLLLRLARARSTFIFGSAISIWELEIC